MVITFKYIYMFVFNIYISLTFYNIYFESVSITTKILSSKLVHDEVYSIQHYVISLSVTCDMSVVFSGYRGSPVNIYIYIYIVYTNLVFLEFYFSFDGVYLQGKFNVKYECKVTKHIFSQYCSLTQYRKL